VYFVEKAIFACPLAAKPLIELGRWNPISLALLAPLWSYQVLGGSDHWWFVARSADRLYYYITQFGTHKGINHASSSAQIGLDAAITGGLQYSNARWWYARPWTCCQKRRTKRDLDDLVTKNPAIHSPYSWFDNNCQHFALNLHEGVGSCVA